VPVPGSGGEVAAPPPAAPAVAPTESAATHYQAGLQAKKNQDYDTAIAELKQAVALDANLVDAHWVLAWAYVEKKQDALAADEFRAVIRLAQGSSKATEAQAALKRMGQPASAP